MSQSQSIVFFVDRCLGSKRLIETLRNSGISVEIHDDHFQKGAEDVDWLPEVGKRGWVVLTKDARSGKRTSEKIAVASARVKMFALASQNLSGEQMSEAFLKAIRLSTYKSLFMNILPHLLPKSIVMDALKCGKIVKCY
ncbi:MAG: hypothetical protein PUP92_35095 [Rhizonema sp. PD38]|nr:hypothetical protein [Rhizonema sp. PD38]